MNIFGLVKWSPFPRYISARSGLLLEGSEPCKETLVGHLVISWVLLGTFLHIWAPTFKNLLYEPVVLIQCHLSGSRPEEDKLLSCKSVKSMEPNVGGSMVWMMWDNINWNSGLKSHGRNFNNNKMFPTVILLQWGTHPQQQWWRGKCAFGSTLQGIVSTEEESCWSPKSFKLGLCLWAFAGTCPGVPWGHPRFVSGSNQKSLMGWFCRYYLLKCLFTTVWQHWILDTGFVLTHIFARICSEFMEVVVGTSPPMSCSDMAMGTGGIAGDPLLPSAPDGMGRYPAWPALTMAAPRGEAILQTRH